MLVYQFCQRKGDATLNDLFTPLPARVPVTDGVFDAVQSRVLSLDLPPGSRLSEADVARQMGVSRQPVRDAFRRLSDLGLLSIRPQRATEVSRISVPVILAARFLRMAAEMEMARLACTRLAPPDIARLQGEIDRQARTIAEVDPVGFKRHDDAFHQGLCIACGLGAVWPGIAESKAHTDRLRILSIRVGSQEALEDHQAILDAIAARDPDRAAAMVRRHLDRIRSVIDDVRADHPDWFAEELT